MNREAFLQRIQQAAEAGRGYRVTESDQRDEVGYVGVKGPLHAVFARSDVAHGRLVTVHTDEAAEMPGVVEVLTAAELGVAPHHGFIPVHPDFARPPLAEDVVRFVGEPIAVVLAETATTRFDAAETIWADVEPLEKLVEPEPALAATIPQSSA